MTEDQKNALNARVWNEALPVIAQDLVHLEAEQGQAPTYEQVLAITQKRAAQALSTIHIEMQLGTCPQLQESE